MKNPIRLIAVVFSLLLCVAQVQAEAENPHDSGPGMAHGLAAGGVLGAMDSNGDGVISRAEFDVFNAGQFDQMDGNKDGMLSMDELNAGHKRVAGDTGNSVTSHLDMRFNAADSNQDGGLDRTEAGEMPMLSIYFDEVDANKDGKVTRQEYFDAMPLLHKAKQDKSNML